MNVRYSRADLARRYASGENITELLRGSSAENSESIIELAYDLQCGSYVQALSEPTLLHHKMEYGAEIASVISKLGNVKTIMEAGVGEATTLSFVLKNIAVDRAFGFDISWSRVQVATDWLRSQEIQTSVKLFTASLFAIPLPDNSIDVVYTSHSIEPNGGREAEALKELYRVTGDYLVLREPAYDFATDDARARMKKHGYCVRLFDVIKELGYDVLKHGLFPYTANVLNPTGITIIRKRSQHRNAPVYVCPETRGELKDVGGALFSKEFLAAYPVLHGIPCLRSANAIICSKLQVTATGDSE